MDTRIHRLLSVLIGLGLASVGRGRRSRALRFMDGEPRRAPLHRFFAAALP